MANKAADTGERDVAIKHLLKGLGIAIAIYLGMLILTTISFAYWKYGVKAGTTEMVVDYLKTIVNPIKFYGFYSGWMDNKTFDQYDWRIFGFPTEIFFSAISGITFLFIWAASNPGSFANTSLGNARMAKTEDIMRMKLLGAKKPLIVLGEWQKKFLMLPETLSVLCVAPPGTGKTTAIVIPTILTNNEVSMLINDVKPELFDQTSHARSRHSHCFRLEWAASDQPEKGIFLPRWNALSPLSMPPKGPNRDLYIERLVGIIVEEPEGNADPHWTKKGRATLAGFIHYLVGKCESGNYDGLPEDWVGKEPSIPMLLDWMTASIRRAEKQQEEARAKSGPMAVMGMDPMKDFLRNAANEAEENDYSKRAVMELTAIANTPDKERGSILSTMDSGLIIFRNSAVRDRTMKSDFAFKEFRGIQDPNTGKWTPLTVYICVNQEDARSLGIITGLLVEALSAYLVAHPPNGTARNGDKLGPCDVLFVLDEFPQMPKLQALIDGPAVGRGQRVSYLMIGQDLGQIKAKYGEDEMETVISTTAAKVILPLNNEVTAKRFSEMVGQYTLELRSKSRTHGLSKETNPFAFNIQRSLQGQPLLRPEDFMSIPAGKHYVLYQGNKNRPIKCDTPAYYAHKELKKLVYAPAFGSGEDMVPASYIPEYALKLRKKEYEDEKRQEELKESIKRHIRLQEEKEEQAKQDAIRMEAEREAAQKRAAEQRRKAASEEQEDKPTPARKVGSV